AGDAGETHSGNGHDLATRGCVYAGDTTFAPAPTYKFCEFATLNKANSHESRVHHVETPNGLVGADGYVPVDAGFVWITELAYQLNLGDTQVEGMSGQNISDLGIPSPVPSVNTPETYSLALLATSENQKRGRQFIDFLRSPEGQAVYTTGGFTGLTPAELDGGWCYSKPVNGVSVATNRTGPGSCDDWLDNGSIQ
ncbi:MAG: substrate-binding domain-containing protein, partial [Gammaproteobacteria bacterium]|nr:substrate-binding domain-containing protein [Gammaproteobacteria bacterium]